MRDLIESLSFVFSSLSTVPHNSVLINTIGISNLFVISACFSLMRMGGDSAAVIAWTVYAWFTPLRANGRTGYARNLVSAYDTGLNPPVFADHSCV
jgi:hypothetical protein